jgi:hypothetical protein
MIIWGGSAAAGWLATGGRYRPVADTWSVTNTGAGLPSPRDNHAAVWTGSEMIVWGGRPTTSVGGRYCACATAAPTTVPTLTVTKPTGGSTTTQLSWTSVVNASSYDVVRGRTSTLTASGGNYGVATDACLLNNQAVTTFADPTVPPVGDSFWYLVRGASCGGVGSYDASGTGQPGPKDAQIAASGLACP